MSFVWTAQQVIALAPDASCARAGQELSQARKWSALGRTENAVWGEHEGSGKDPYRTRVDLREPAFKCTCPSRKFPCKHGLGLLLALVESPNSFPASAPPGWVAEWLAERDQRADARTKKPETRAESPVEAEGKKKRAEQREFRVAEGLEALALWLRDLVRQGLAGLASQPASFFESMAARLVDAQAPGAARWIRNLQSLNAASEDRERRLLAHVARIHLLVEGYRRLGSLPAETQADVRAAVGWTASSAELLQQPGAGGPWQVLGRRVETEDRLFAVRTWLWNPATRRPALILAFGTGTQPVEPGPPPGTEVDGELVFFPGSVLLRALEKSRLSAPRPIALPQDELGWSLQEAVSQAAIAKARNPWLERFPLSLRAVIPERRGQAWIVRCTDAASLPISARFHRSWELLALSGGRPLGLLGEWDGHELYPLSAWTREGFHEIGTGEVA